MSRNRLNEKRQKEYKNPTTAATWTFLFGPFLGMLYVGLIEALIGWMFGLILVGAWFAFIRLVIVPYTDNIEDIYVTLMLIGSVVVFINIPSIVYAVYATKRRNLRYGFSSTDPTCQQCGYNLLGHLQARCPHCRGECFATNQLHKSTDNGSIDEIMNLLEQGADIEAKDESGWTPLHISAWNEQEELLKFLISKGANVNNKDRRGITPLHITAQKGNSMLTNILLAKGAKVNIRDRIGMTPLLLAVHQGHLNIVKSLLQKGAMLKMKNKKGETALQIASAEGHSEVANFLKNIKAK